MKYWEVQFSWVEVVEAENLEEAEQRARENMIQSEMGLDELMFDTADEITEEEWKNYCGEDDDE